MLFYDWEKIFDAADGNPRSMYLILKMMAQNSIPDSRHSEIYKYSFKDFSGKSFLIHPDLLLYNAYRHSYREIAQYLALASMRPLADYATTGESSLDVRLIELDLELITTNSLLSIKNDKVHFLYEEANQETIH